VPEHKGEQNGPEASRKIEHGPFESAATVMMDTDADEKGQADGQAQ
jgi:hypothetical protein